MTRKQLRALITAILLTDHSQSDDDRTIKRMSGIAEEILDECDVGSDSDDDEED